jgi:hypothetical protein
MTKRRRRAADALDQQSLFRTPTREPNWDALADDVRTAVTSLVARMLREQWARERREQVEAKHE